MATYLTRTQAAGNPDKWNLSVWVKRSDLTGDNSFSNIIASPTGDQGVWIDSAGNIDIYGAGSVRLKPKAKLRDVSAWYHIVVSYNSTDSTENDRIICYLNGTRLTDFHTNNMPSLNEDSTFNVSGNVLHVGRRASSAEHYFKGYMAEMIFTDGYNYGPSTFGSTNSDGIWVPNTAPSVTYGTNGFRLQFKNSGASADSSGFGADTSGNNNHLASNALGTNPNTSDSPQNNFGTLDLNNDRTQGGFTFNLGLMKVVTSGSNRNYACLTQAFKTGKWYMECRYTGGVASAGVGICDMNDLQMTGTSSLGDLSNEIAITADGNYEKNNSVTSGWAGSFTTNDILGLCLDCDNNRFTLSKNGQFADGSGNYDEANPTAYITYTAGNFMTFAFGERTSGGTATIEINTGNAPYTIASGNADANGYGSFEYAVPSGYYAVCTKNMATYG